MQHFARYVFLVIRLQRRPQTAVIVARREPKELTESASTAPTDTLQGRGWRIVQHAHQVSMVLHRQPQFAAFALKARLVILLRRRNFPTVSIVPLGATV
jgi:hypothetical protein